MGLGGILIKLLDVLVEQLARGGIAGVLDGPEGEVVDEVDNLSHLPYFLQNLDARAEIFPSFVKSSH